MRKTKITLYISDEEKELIKNAGKIVALDFSGFCRSSSIGKANQILRENQEEAQ